MTPRIIFLVVLRTVLIVLAYGTPALRLYRARQVVPQDKRLSRRLLDDYLLLLSVGIADVVMWGVLLTLPLIVPEAVRLQPWYLPALIVMWLGESLNFVYAGWRLGRVLEPDPSEQESSNLTN